jgi:2-polyprenyl-3-methyl-5-hydroxy-6-metoxy-1,4-benzoquinol methylase
MTPSWTEGAIEELLRASGYREEWHVRRLVQTALRVPRAVPGARLVDLGTHPAVLNVLAQVGGYEQAEGVDWSDGGPASWTVDLPKRGSWATRRYQIHNRDLQRDRLPFDDESVDLVTCLETLEHLLDPMHLLIEANRILKTGGSLLLTTPNVVSWRSMLRAAVHKHPLVYPALVPGLTTNRHNIEYTPDLVRSLLTAAGFEGKVATRAWWYRVHWLDKARLTLAGFRPRDRGDIILAQVRKASAPRERFPADVYQVQEADRNASTTLSYRPS